MVAMTGYAPREVAERTGLSVDALRYYEREGLVGPIARSAGGQRRYDDADVAWIGLVTCLRDAGLGIEELRRFTRLLRTEAPGGDRVAFLRARRAELEEQAQRIRSAVRVLDEKIAHYAQDS